jgi:hypothetical protein
LTILLHYPAGAIDGLAHRSGLCELSLSFFYFFFSPFGDRGSLLFLFRFIFKPMIALAFSLNTLPGFSPPTAKN